MQGFFSKISKREKLILYVSIAAALLALMDRAVIAPISGRLRVFEEEIKTTEFEMVKNSKIIQQRQRIEAEEKKYASYFVNAASDEEQTALLLREIENLAGASSVYLVDLKPAGVIEEGLVEKFQVNLSCEAEMEQLFTFMYALENSEMLLRLGAYALTPKSKQSSVNRCELLLYKIVIP